MECRRKLRIKLHYVFFIYWYFPYLLCSYIFLGSLFSNILILFSLREMRRQIELPYRATYEAQLLYILIFNKSTPKKKEAAQTSNVQRLIMKWRGWHWNKLNEKVALLTFCYVWRTEIRTSPASVDMVVSRKPHISTVQSRLVFRRTGGSGDSSQISVSS